jgi:uncharacterized FlaG/YvyC family protein
VNKTQRKVLETLASNLREIKFTDEGKDDALMEIKTSVEATQSEEQEKYDNMPEGLQSGSKGEDLQNVIDELQSIIDGLDEAVDIEEDEEFIDKCDEIAGQMTGL